MNGSRLEYLFDRFYNRTCTEAEKAEFKALLQTDSQDEAVKRMIDRVLEHSEGELLLSPESSAAILQAAWKAGRDADGLNKEKNHAIQSAPSLQQVHAVQKVPTVQRVPTVQGAHAVQSLRFMRTAWFRYAAMIILLFGVGTFIYLSRQSPKQIARQNSAPSPGIILPGGSKALLTLADGSKIVLDSTADGTLARQGDLSIVKSANCLLAYHPSQGPGDRTTAADGNAGKNSSAAGEAFNTIATPKGGQYQVVLPDGTKVWLNAISSIKFPTSFSTGERHVEVKGEVYFEVKTNPKHPFLVTAEGVDIRVLGTSFNVNAYSDEGAVKTTLIDGKVRVNTVNHTETLIPGQQAELDKTGSFKIIADIDTEEVMAWKNGYFYFKHADLPTVLRQLARWYDMTIEYRGTIPDMTFGGDIPRDASAAEVFKILEKMKLHFTVEGKKVIVTP